MKKVQGQWWGWYKVKGQAELSVVARYSGSTACVTEEQSEPNLSSQRGTEVQEQHSQIHHDGPTLATQSCINLAANAI